MPTYQYACTACGSKIEIFQSFTDDPLVTCDDCEGPLRKVFSPVGIVFKGSGFYRTDSRDAKSSPVASARSDSPKADSATSATSQAAASTSGAAKPSSGSGSGTSAGSAPAGTAGRGRAAGDPGRTASPSRSAGSTPPATG